MAITYHSGRRIQGVNTDFKGSTAGSWKEVGRAKLSSSSSSNIVVNVPNKRYYMVLQNILGAGGEVGCDMRFNGDSGTNYPMRRNTDRNPQTGYAAEFTRTTTYSYLYNGYGGTDTDRFAVVYISNPSDREKLVISDQCVNVNRSNQTSAPSHTLMVGKWKGTEDINKIEIVPGTSLAANSEVIVLGYDPKDTHITNFWEELSTTSLSANADNLNSSVFKAKKYIWFQAYMVNSGSIQLEVNMGNDTIDPSSIYCSRYSYDSGTSTTRESEDSIESESPTSNPAFINGFIVNNATNVKLLTSHIVHQNTTGAAGTPKSVEMIGKWANTSVQANVIGIKNSGGGSFASGSILKVWGHD